MAGDTLRVDCAHCGERGVLPMATCPTCDKPLPKPAAPRAGQDERSAFTSRLRPIIAAMRAGSLSDADGFEQQASLYRSFGFTVGANRCLELAQAARGAS